MESQSPSAFSFPATSTEFGGKTSNIKSMFGLQLKKKSSTSLGSEVVIPEESLRLAFFPRVIKIAKPILMLMLGFDLVS